METASLVPVVSLAAVVSAGVTIFERSLQPRRLALFRHLKPFTTLLILIVAMLPGTFLREPYAATICLGLVLSIAGDLLLTLPGRFLHGLGCFLLALLCYIAAFLGGLESRGFLWALIGLGVIAEAVRRSVWPGLRGLMKAAVTAYMAVMVFMVALAIGRAAASPATGTVAAAAGACLLLVSDSLLAIDRFRRPFHLVHLAVLGTYYVAQLLIALSVGMRS
jgi:uncharacterized membrane protein YhhN